LAEPFPRTVDSGGGLGCRVRANSMSAFTKIVRQPGAVERSAWVGIRKSHGATAKAFLKIQTPPLFPNALIAPTTFSCKDIAQGGCGRFQPINMPTHIQNRVTMIFSETVRCRELESYYGSFMPGLGRVRSLRKSESRLIVPLHL
jgi:hypothetical protein